MTKKVLLLHGWGGSDFPHWQSWLASELVKEYGCVNFLRFSNFDTPKLDVWREELEETLEDFKPDIVHTPLEYPMLPPDAKEPFVNHPFRSCLLYKDKYS